MSEPFNIGSALAQDYRRRLLRVLLAFTAIFGVLFIVINLFAGKYMLMTVEIGVSLFACWLFTVAAHTSNLQRWTLVYLIVLYSGTMYAFTTPVTHVSVFSWVMVIPMVSHLLLGRFWGGILSCIFLPISAAIFIWRFGSDTILTDPGSIANIATVVACSYLLSHVYEASRSKSERKLSQMALTDSLTGLPNRSQLVQSYEQAMASQRLPLSLVMIDLDYFKRINDAYGHDTGDAVLRAIADTMQAHVRQHDLACRLGGEEFCLLLPDTNAGDAQLLAQRLREAIQALQCRHREAILRLTASSGIATVSDASQSLDRVLHVADQNLYKAKLGGRNQVVA